MRILAAIAGVTLVALIASWLMLRSATSSVQEAPTPSVAFGILTDVLEHEPELGQINVGELYPGRVNLIHPKIGLPRSQEYAFREISGLWSYAKTCAASEAPSVSPSLEKALLWARFCCGEVPELPSSFFEQAPYVHPSGHSFVFLASSRFPQRYDRRWLGARASYALPSELSEIPAKYSASYRPISALSADIRARVADGELYALDKARLAVRNTAASGPFALSYRIYDEGSVARRLERYGLMLERGGAHPCVASTPGLCIQSLPARSDAVAALQWFSGGSLAILVLSSVSLLFVWTREQRRGREDRLFVLRALTHELRTPVTGLSLSIEPVRADFERLSSEGQQAVLELCEAIARVKRVISGTARYLRAYGSGSRSRFHLEKVRLDEVVNELVRAQESEVELDSLSECSAITDVHWLAVCIQNLLDNARAHGQPPVRVALRTNGPWSEIVVRDEGRQAATSLAGLLSGRPGPKEGGLGLGLRIVDKVLKDLGGQLRYSSPPTTFVIRLRRAA